MDAIGRMLSRRMIDGVDGWNRSLGIRHSRTSAEGKAAWDMHCVIRHRLAWDRAIREGIVKPDEPRKWPEMMTVDYDEPFCVSGDPLPTIQRA